MNADYKLLAVDDDEISREMLLTILASMGIQCHKAANGKEALTELESNPDTDIVLLDLEMPIMNGFAFLELRKEIPHFCSIPVIVVSSSRDDKVKSLKLGADDFVSKPYDPEELELRITKLVQAKRMASCAQLAKQEFLAVANHELRTPMNGIIGLTDLLLNERDASDGQKELLKLLRVAADNLLSVIQSILDYTQSESGVDTVELVPFSLQETIRHVTYSLKEKADENGILININIANEVPEYLIGAQTSLRKILSILLENSIKFSTAEEINLSITADPFGDTGVRLHCSVNDNGKGIPAEFHEKIFEPFKQVDGSHTRKQGGLGLGLSIAQRLMQRLGGALRVSSEQGVGSSFQFEFLCMLPSSAKVPSL